MPRVSFCVPFGNWKLKTSQVACLCSRSVHRKTWSGSVAVHCEYNLQFLLASEIRSSTTLLVRVSAGYFISQEVLDEV